MTVLASPWTWASRRAPTDPDRSSSSQRLWLCTIYRPTTCALAGVQPHNIPQLGGPSRAAWRRFRAFRHVICALHGWGRPGVGQPRPAFHICPEAKHALPKLPAHDLGRHPLWPACASGEHFSCDPLFHLQAGACAVYTNLQQLHES